jgi:hypothetical protein
MFLPSTPRSRRTSLDPADLNELGAEAGRDDEIGARAEKLHHVACGEQRAHAIAQYRVDAAQRLGIAVEYRDIGAHAARLLHCIQKRSRCSSSRLSPSRLVYSQPLFVEIRSDWRRRTVEKPAR